MLNDPRAFTRACDIICIILCAGCAAAFAVSFWGGEANMLGFPVLFLLAALFNFFSSWIRFRKDIRGRNQKAAGIGFLLAGILMLAVSYVLVICLW